MSLATFSPLAASGGKISPLSTFEDEESTSQQQFTIPTIGRLYALESVTPHPPPSHPPKPTAAADTTMTTHQWRHLYVLPVLLLEFLAIALTRAVLPHILLQEYGSRVYLVLGCADCIRGLLAFFACPLFGKLSDIIGRRVCLLITVIGTCAPVCCLAFFSWEGSTLDANNATTAETETAATTATTTTTATATMEQQQNNVLDIHYTLPPTAIPLFVILLSLSGIFSSTFTLVFAYISDTVRQRDERVSAYGLALATFGLSFTVGPMAGGYLAQSHTHYVFGCSLALTILDVLYIYFILPESLQLTSSSSSFSLSSIFSRRGGQFDVSLLSPFESIRLLLRDPFLGKVGEVAFFYYTGLWAVISTLSLYAVQHFGLTPERLGELMSALGLATMVAEAVLVRVLVPLIGEKRATRLGLLSFGLQCLVLGFAYEGWHLFVCVGFSMLGNLVYPSLSSLVSGTVEPESVGEALGAVNGVKALTEGIGPLVFGAMMTMSEHSAFPGWPYWIASILVFVAYNVADRLPDIGSDHNEYIHELEFKKRSSPQDPSNKGCLTSTFETPTRDEEDEEYRGLLTLSEVEESDDDDRIEIPALPQTIDSPNATSAPIGSPPFRTPPQTMDSLIAKSTRTGSSPFPFPQKE